jgi:hypothetical protein
MDSASVQVKLMYVFPSMCDTHACKNALHACLHVCMSFLIQCFLDFVLVAACLPPLLLAAAVGGCLASHQPHNHQMFLQKSIRPCSSCCAQCRRRSHNWRRAASETAKRGKAVSPSCLRSLVEMEASQAAKSGNPDALRFALDQKEPRSWDDLMGWVIESGSLDCVKVLYDKGYEQHRSEDPYKHPAVDAICHGHLEILRFVVDHSGRPDENWLPYLEAVEGGVEMLQYLQDEFGFDFNEEITAHAASLGNLEVLRYLHMSGARGIPRHWKVRYRGTPCRA